MKLRFISLLFLFLCFYFFRLYQTPRYFIPENEPVKIVGRVNKQPYLKDSYQIIEINQILIKTNLFPGYFYGDKLIVFGKFKKEVINPFVTRYFAFFPAIQKVQEEENLDTKKKIIRFLLKTRGQVEKNLIQFLPEPQASLLLGVVFGVKSQMPQDFWQNLRKTGTLHLVVASGQNVALVAGFLTNALTWFLKRRVAILFSLLGILFYVLMVGAETPVVRAGLMTGMMLLGQFWGREGDEKRFFLLTAIIILLISPLMLFDIGFQLSFTATAGLIWVYPKLKSKTFCLPKQNNQLLRKIFSSSLLGEAFWVTLSAQLTTLPILLVNFGQFSWFSPLVNSFVIPTIPFVMSLGLFLAPLSFISKFLSQVLAWFLWPFLSWFVKVVNFFGQLTWINCEVGKISWWWVVVYYLFLVIFLSKLNVRVRNP